MNLAALFRLARGNWMPLAFVAILGWQQLQTAAARRENADLRRELSNTVKVVEEKDKQQALALGRIERMFETFRETLEAVRTPTGPVIVRVTEGRPGPAGTPGRPGLPGAPGAVAPMIPPEAAATARAAAVQRIVVGIRAGHLRDCPTPGLSDPDSVELLRDPSGRLLSPTSCVARIREETRLREEPKAERPEPSRWKTALGYGTRTGTVGGGLAYEWVRLGPFSLDAVLVGTPSVHVGPGASWAVTPSLTLGPAYLWDAARREFQPWVVLGFRP